mmetsp:Transcript_7425/g.13407  ORF Transcript_7425/g.13407 Transcript_7425/m.13407 type:complete len:391 (-) Transcript_7425:1362-2534(-)
MEAFVGIDIGSVSVNGFRLMHGSSSSTKTLNNSFNSRRSLKCVPVSHSVMNRGLLRMNAEGSTGDSIDFDKIAAGLASELGGGQDSTESTTDVSDSVQVGKGENDMETVTLIHTPTGQRVVVYTFGATVTSWKARADSKASEDVFFLSDVAKYDGKTAIRGGIPVCFPQFGPYGKLSQHGFARNTQWTIKSSSVLPDKSVELILELDSTADQPMIEQWCAQGQSFSVEYAIRLSFTGLETALSVTNTTSDPSADALEITAAFHNYFQVTDIANARVFGLEHCKFADRLANDEESTEKDDGGAGKPVESATDRIYFSTPEELAVFDFASLRVVKLKKTPTMPDATLWNPYGADGCDPGWKRFLCLETAAIQKPIKLSSGESWTGAQLIAVE